MTSIRQDFKRTPHEVLRNQCSRTSNTKSKETTARIIAEKNERSEKVAPVIEKVAPVTPTKYHPAPAAIAMNITAGTK